MDNELYLQKLRSDYIQMGENYVLAVREHKPNYELRHITLTIRSVLAEIKAVEQEVSRKTA